MCLVFGKQRGAIMPCLDPLRRSTEADHKVAIYALALLLYRPNSGDSDDDEARQLLRMAEGPETLLPDHFGAVGLGAVGGWCADTHASPGRTSMCGRRLWRARRMVCLVLVAQVLQRGVSDRQRV